MTTHLDCTTHVRDLCRAYRIRLDLMLEHDDAGFADWDQDATAVAERYAEQDPALVAAELTAEAGAHSGSLRAVEPFQLARRGLRSDGSAFTVDSLARYFLHDALRHLWDVTPRG